MQNNIKKAKDLRKNMTPQEHKIWSLLKAKKINNLKFRRQHPIGNYIVDFVCIEKKLIIELDGGQHNTPETIEYDNRRTEYLKSKGYNVLRFWNNDIMGNLEGVYEVILRNLQQ